MDPALQPPVEWLGTVWSHAMALPNHPDTLPALVQEHSAENLDGSAL
jgi:hypothetical protein